MTIRIGTRGSQLARWQTDWVAGELRQLGHEVEIRVITTKGDVVQDRFDKMEGKGFFTKELEDALLNEEIDVAVHSLKDLPTDSPDGLSVIAIPRRANPADLLISTQAMKPEKPILTKKRIGTSSLRRIRALEQITKHCRFEPIRGNVPTRLRKLQEGSCDAIVLAAAGISRLNIDLSDLHVCALPFSQCTPAPGQGALAIQTRSHFMLDLSAIHDPMTASCVTAERWVLAQLDGGCQLPLGVHIHPVNQAFELDLFYASDSVHTYKTVGPDPMACAEDALEYVKRSCR
ncbi:MAG: hydroxymethylbilane synthase [Acidobacteria bacterium]|nr:hydroxymethylbilane synthase [Acidobacteriota bacterium]